jgi:hypothetical protein
MRHCRMVARTLTRTFIRRSWMFRLTASFGKQGSITAESGRWILSRRSVWLFSRIRPFISRALLLSVLLTIPLTWRGYLCSDTP